jgi:RNA polymerase sigma-70 factor (ECF subfamily)
MATTSPSLLQRLCETPDRVAWNRFVELYTPLLVGWANRLGLQTHDAADLVQDIFSVLAEKLPTFRYDSEKSFRAWLKTLLMNRWRNHLRRSNRSAAHRKMLPTEEAENAAPEFEEAEYRTYLVSRALNIMRAEFETTTWKACWEFVVNDRPAEEVARELGISINAVYLAKSRVLRRLRDELNGLIE